LAFNAQGSRVIIVVVQVRAVKIFVAATPHASTSTFVYFQVFIAKGG
jgi:hypothetical protein